MSRDGVLKGTNGMSETNRKPRHDVIRNDYRGRKPHGLTVDDEARNWAHHASVYHSKPDAEPEFKAVAQGCEDFLITILRNCPPGADRTRALNGVREARMWANSSIAMEDE